MKNVGDWLYNYLGYKLPKEEVKGCLCVCSQLDKWLNQKGKSNSLFSHIKVSKGLKMVETKKAKE